MKEYGKPIIIIDELHLEDTVLFSGLINNGIAPEIGSEGEKFGG